MQKISSYLYPNKIYVVADVALYPVRWKIVYQNRIKIYQGVDNVLELDVKNADQKRMDISGMDLKVSITDTAGRYVSLASVVPGAILGLATVTVPSEDIANIEAPQFLYFTIYRLNEDESKTIFYADTGFGAVGNMELVGSAVPVETPPRFIESFYKRTNFDTEPNLTWWFSEAVSVFQPNLIGPEEDRQVEMKFDFNQTKATVTVQFTEERIPSTNTTWTDIVSFGVFPGETTVTKTIPYPLYKRSTSWVRLKVMQDNYNGYGATVDVTKQNGNEYAIKLRDHGSEYKTGETYIIEGRLVGGDIGESPNGAWSIHIDHANTNGEIIAITALAEAPVAETSTVKYTQVALNPKQTARAVDKVTIRLL